MSVRIARREFTLHYKYTGLTKEKLLSKEVLSRLNKVYREQIEPGGSLYSYKRKSNRARLNQVLRNTNGRWTKKRRQSLIDAYQLAWKRAYQRNVVKAKSLGLGQDESYQEWKRKSVREGHSERGRKIRYQTPLLLTGNLRRQIMTGFAQGGNKHLQIPNLLLFGAYRVDFRYFEKPWRYDRSGFSYVERLMQFLEGKGMEREEFFDFDPGRWRLIATRMLAIVEKDFIPKMQKEF